MLLKLSVIKICHSSYCVLHDNVIVVFNAFIQCTYYRFHKVYDSLYNLCLEEDSICPEKYIVEGHPPMNAFPTNHPNRALYTVTDAMGIKDEL